MTAPAADLIAARELSLYATNDGKLYRSTALPIIANLAKKQRAGTYDPKLALKAWFNYATEASAAYSKEFGAPMNARHHFDVPTRWHAAKEIAEHYADQLEETAAAA
jgi:hypothetical protein